MRKCYLLLFAVIAFLAPLRAGAPTNAPHTLMLQPGKILASDDLTKSVGKAWFTNKGKWVIADGALRGSELAADKHGAVKRLPVKFNSAVIAYSFRLEGAKATTLSINAAKGHVCRVKIWTTGFSVQRDADKTKNEKAIVLDTHKVSIAPNEWHAMVIELRGPELLARLDGKQVAYGSNAGIAMPKANIGFTVAGESASFKNLRVYEGTPLKTWEATRAKLYAERKK